MDKQATLDKLEEAIKVIAEAYNISKLEEVSGIILRICEVKQMIERDL